jgi:2-polyprenyl-6-methoxyphenol hydroxylase-like FAD-dependent oxidoreductase
MAYDVIVVGGGLGGSVVAKILAERGLSALVLEKETRFRDRVRGEGLLPWGVNEARDLGIYDLLESECGRPVNYWTSHSWEHRPPRNLLETTPRAAPCLTFHHPEMQEVMLAAAREAGAEVRRGVRVSGVRAGASPSVTVTSANGPETIDAHLIVGADGRESVVRQACGFDRWTAPERLMTAGLLLENASMPSDSIHIFRDSAAGEGALLFPEEANRVRAYFIYRSQGERRGLSGKGAVPLFIECCTGLGVPRNWLAKAAAGGPLAEFSGADKWVKHPYKEGVALVGDAASSNDPAWGNGLALTLRDARTLTECFDESTDRDEAGAAYAHRHDEYFGAINRVTGWLTDLLYEVGPEADARREKAFAAMKHDKSRNPDYIANGPESPSDERARQRMFGEN